MTYTINKIKIESSTHDYKIPAVLTMPNDVLACPAVILCHGTGSNKDEAGNGYVYLANHLAARGIASLRFDFIGCGESKVDYIDYTFTSAQRDIMDVLTYLESCSQIDKNKIGILGWSQGGTMALLAAANDSRFKTVISWAGADKIKTLFDEEAYTLAQKQGYSMLELGFREPLRLSLQWMNEALNTDVLKEFSKSNASVLAIAGTEDDVVDPVCANRIVSVSKHEKSRVEFIEGADHCFNILSGDLKLFNELMELTVHWLETALYKDELIERYWQQFLTDTHRFADTNYHEAFHFDLNKESANELLKLVLSGKKKATASSVYEWKADNDVLKEGDLSIVTDWDGMPACIIKTTKLQTLPFCEMTFELCSKEGEDTCLETWQQNHERFFTADGKQRGYTFTWDMPVVFEEFEVIYQKPLNSPKHFRALRRNQQALSVQECYEILEHANTGVLAVLGDDNYPYTIPLNYCLAENKIYIHCAKDGHKIDAIRRCDKVSFCVIGKDELQPELFTTFYQSVVVFGKASMIENDAEKRFAITALCDKYVPHLKAEGQREIDSFWNALTMIQIDIEHISGKQTKDLAEA